MAPIRIRPFLVAPLIAVLLLSACGSSLQSPAAVVNGVRITQKDLTDRLALILTNPQLRAQIHGPGGGKVLRDVTRSVLAGLVRRDVIDAWARTRHVVVSPGDVARALGAVVQQAGGLAKFRQLLRQRGLTEDEVRQDVYESLVEQQVHNVIVSRAGSGATAQQADQLFNTWYAEQLRRANVQVNPRYGLLDAKTGAICPVDTTADSVSCPPA